MNLEEYKILTNLMRNFINERQHLNIASIAREIVMERQNFNAWLKFDRPLPYNKVEKLEFVLKLYGFSSV